jgi:hypothetical protein
VKVDIGLAEVACGICYDLRFPELFRQLAPFDVMILPAAFTATTGEAHWEVLMRARAIENQCLCDCLRPGGTHENGRKTHGQSMIIDPWGRILAQQASGEGVVLAELTPHCCIRCAVACRPWRTACFDRKTHHARRFQYCRSTAACALWRGRSRDRENLSRMRQHAVDYADLYFQYTRSEGWSLEEGIVKSGSFSIDQGVGVRAVSGDKTAFAYSDDIGADAITRAADAVRAIGLVGGDGSAGRQSPQRARDLYPAIDPCHSLEAAAKVALLEKVEKLARAMDPRVIQVMAGVARNMTWFTWRGMTACALPMCVRWCGCRCM